MTYRSSPSYARSSPACGNVSAAGPSRAAGQGAGMVTHGLSLAGGADFVIIAPPEPRPAADVVTGDQRFCYAIGSVDR